jgi:capsular exopolysaccharide synthesis family protein
VRLVKEGGTPAAAAQDSLLGTYPDSGALPLIGGSVRLTGEGRQLERITIRLTGRIDAAEGLRGSIQVDQPNKDANVLSITYRGTDPDLVRQIPNAIAHEFVREQMQQDRSGATAQVDYLTRQLGQLSGDLAERDQRIRDYLERQQISSISQATLSLGDELGKLQGLRRELEFQRENIARAMEPLTDADTATAQLRWLRRLEATPDFLRSGVASDLVSRLNALLGERAELATRLLPGSEQIAALDSRIAETESQIRQRTTQYLANLDEQIAGLGPRIDSVSARLQKIPAQSLEYGKLERERQVVEQMMSLVQSRLKEAEIAAAVQDSTARVLDEAVAPIRQTGSSETLIFAVAVVSGLLVGVAVAWLRDWLDTTVRTEADLSRIVGVAVVGIIPNLQQQARVMGYRLPTPKEGEELRPTTSRDYQTPAAEAYRTLRTNLNYLTPPRPPRIIVVTSALPGDGKTTTAVNLAVTLAHQGQRVILIDAETRRGTVHEVFGIPPAPGFFDLMYGQASPGECIRRVQMEVGGTIDVLPLGSAPSVNPADLLVEARLQPLFDRLRAQYDYVLLDTPPLNLFTDAALIGARSDALLLVARADRTDREELRFAVQQLRNVQVTLAGSILNDVELRRGSRYRAGYGYYYDYAR